MKELIERLERATEGSRELDAIIVWTLAGMPIPENAAQRMAEADEFGIYVADPYTTSIDAALTLVPGGVKWSVGTRDREAWGMKLADPEVYWADVTPYIGHGNDTASLSPALALCIAALRARSSKAEE